MSNLNASVSNESKDRTSPKADGFNLEATPTNTKHPQCLQNTTNQNKDSLDNSNMKVKAKSIGNYILGKTLGEGTFGKVKLATHIFTGEKVAIKILEKDRIIDVSDVERVAREIYILKFIRHPNITQLYEIIETPKLLFLVMEYISGGELFDYIVANTKVEEKEASQFFHQIIDGVEYVHKLKIVHRDLKPENLILDHDKNIKIIDFGLSNTYNENELLKTACGSPCYAAPEMIGGKKYDGLQVDIWSCGVILFAIVCGYLPFEDPNTAVLYKKILSGDYTIPSFLSDEGKDLLKNILNTDPTKRYTIDDIRKHPWMNQVERKKRSEGIIVGYHQTPIDTTILRQLEQYGFQYDHAQKCLDANKHNHVTTTYYLLLKKFHKNGGQSPADINSENFDSSLLMPKSSHQPKINNYYSMGHEQDVEKENVRRAERERSRKKSPEETPSFDYSETSFRQRQNKEIAKIYGSILDSSARDRASSNYSSKGSRVLKENNILDNSMELKRRSLAGKRTFSPARNEVKGTKAFENNYSSNHNYNSIQHKQNQFFDKSSNNNTLKDRLREIYKVGGDKPSRSKHPRGDSYDESNGGVYQSFNQELLNGSFKIDVKDVNSSYLCPMPPKLNGQTTKSTNKKQAFISIQTTPKKEKRLVHYNNEEKVPHEPRGGNAYARGTRLSSQSPSKVNQIQPKEPIYTKARDSSMNVSRTGLNSRKNSNRPAVQVTNGKAWRPSTNQARSRERGRSIGMPDDSYKSHNPHESSFNAGNGSFVLNSSFQQKNIGDISFDLSAGHQPKAYLNNFNKRVSYGGGSQDKRVKNGNYSPGNIHKKNLQNLLNKAGVIKC